MCMTSPMCDYLVCFPFAVLALAIMLCTSTGHGQLLAYGKALLRSLRKLNNTSLNTCHQRQTCLIANCI